MTQQGAQSVRIFWRQNNV